MNQRKKRYLIFIFIACVVLFLLGNFMEKESAPLVFNAILYLMILVIGTNLGAFLGEFLPTPKRLKKIDPALDKDKENAAKQKK